ncbi:MAG: hypothetical protein GW795_15745 [Cyanobacteria bacterium]|uniref:hypothetical protein n=1 Tax=Geminocystis sp. TaxID=2664100 RepID=UPI001DDABDC1|nr:hypothetical protein [Cyanobacteria bacterium CG_2015-16_32_12]NCO78264.1 hypothetical protein [Cyanobacteria bacterium CG_2015-22_32_23]NCQ02901.1 hypothetical protein [Cyanobacteria bacterium CG_2015-09_32_10]NCQ43278.1 hypothetical protein [Cyanobacteria bacterium CG_2015-04_32_10]NCS83490.1 hypothetical protein [Cyanobacteria bacterium CG_2015-02_32_10]
MINNSYYNLDKITEPIRNVKPEIKAIVEQVLQLEKDKLSQKNLRYINDDILKIIKENIQ